MLIYADDDLSDSNPAVLDSRLLTGPAVDQVFADENGSGEVLWGLGDHQRTIRDVVTYDDVTNTSTVANHIQYDSFGQITNKSEPTVRDYERAYTGREWDAGVDLQYNHHRWYDPAVGRWISEDPIGFEAGDTNLSRYVHNGPTNATDPTGLWREGGHFYTVYNVSRLAGMDHMETRELAYYAQYMDEVNAYDAAFMGLWHMGGTWKRAADEVGTNEENLNEQWEEDVQTVLHQLHGGDIFEIHRNRTSISQLFETAMSDGDVKFAGILLHAFGDSFAHTKRRDGKTTAFGTRLGHARAKGPLSGERKGGTAVDKIPERYIDNVYKNYVSELAYLLGVKESDNGKVAELIKRSCPILAIVIWSRHSEGNLLSVADGRKCDDRI